jgi:hypothetical protein
MSEPVAAVVRSDDQRWRDWQKSGVEGDRRRSVAMKWVMAFLAIALGVLFSGLL